MSNPHPSTDESVTVYAEPGGRWRTVAYGPVLCVVVLIVEIANERSGHASALSQGARTHWPALLGFAVIFAGAMAVQVVAARRHLRVVLTETALCNGGESVALTRIADVLPADREFEGSQRSRVLGSPADVPRGRTPVFLRLYPDGAGDPELVRTWAVNDRALRSALVATLEHVRSSDR